MSEQPAKLAIGIDVGGTRIKGGLLEIGGRILEKASIPTEADGGVDHVIDCLSSLIERFHQRAASDALPVEAVGLGVPGTLSRRRGIVIAPPNLQGWRNVPIVERLQSATGLRVVLDNDANNAALGEYLCGAGRSAGGMVMLTLGTGIGGGIILNGRLLHGVMENAAELGHTIVHVGGRRCQCGQMGCLEAYASAGSTAARAAEKITAGEPSSLKEVLHRTGSIGAEHVVEAAAAGDALAKQVWEETCQYLAIGCINIQHTLSPGRIVLAGGMSAAGDRLLRPVLEARKDLCSEMLGQPPEIRIAELGNDAGFIGSALSVFE